MKNPATWRPSKYVLRNGKLSASSDTNELGIASRMAAAIVAEYYQNNIKTYAKGVLLDLGCGKSPLYEIYSKHILSSTSADWEGTLHKNNNIDVACDLTQKLPFDDETYDTVILSDVLEHLPNPENLFSEIYRILKIDGTLLLNTPFLYGIHEAPHDYYRYTQFALKRLANISKFKIIKIETTGGSPEVFTDLLAKHLQYIPLVGKISAIFIQRFLLVFRKTKIGKNISQKTAERFPFGYFMVIQK